MPSETATIAPFPPLALSSEPALLLARRACYRFVALALADPLTGVWNELADPATKTLVTEAAEILRDEDAAVARPLALGERPLADLDPATMLARLPRSANEFNELYESNFGLLGGSKCPPYETEYVPSKYTFQRSNMLADVAGFYNAFGLQTSRSNPDRPDHVALECEFLAQLLGLQWQASQSAIPEANTQAEVCQQAIHRFLRAHVAWWFPAFGKLLSRQDPGGFYEAVAHFLAALIAAERAIAGVEPPHQQVEPSPIEIPDECSGCELTIR
jgi:TorA maturation chaperone TorD